MTTGSLVPCDGYGVRTEVYRSPVTCHRDGVTMSGCGPACLECGAAYRPTRAEQRFCCDACRKRFHRRREKRGAELYDLLMITRFDRKGDGPEANMLMARYASIFRDEDARDGRGRSWLTLDELAPQLTQVRATRVA